MAVDEPFEVVKWYTRARRFPQLIGKLPDGRRIWGGPYTYTQVIAGAALIVTLAKTASIWAQFGVIGNIVLGVGATYGLVLALGRVPAGARNPLSWCTGAMRALSAPAAGRYGGAALRVRRPHRVGAGVLISAAPTPAEWASAPLGDQGPADSAPTPAPTPPARAASPALAPARRRGGGPLAAPAPAAALSGVQRLLAHSAQPGKRSA